jgi:NAD(P)-dependent dehydrogenase (short-subunit alcohol dehydrogenase family)
VIDSLIECVHQQSDVIGDPRVLCWGIAEMASSRSDTKANGSSRNAVEESLKISQSRPFKSAYVSAKHGIAGLTKTVALELATFKITCNCISPGYVWTPLVEKQIPDTMKARNLTEEQVIHDVLLEAQPTKEFVTSEQVAALALFLCGDDAAQITGTNLSIDGGWTAAWAAPDRK